MAKDHLEIWSNSSPPNHLSPIRTKKQAHDKNQSLDPFMVERNGRAEDAWKGGIRSGGLQGGIHGCRESLLLGMSEYQSWNVADAAASSSP
jgi:hypothetical protein